MVHFVSFSSKSGSALFIAIAPHCHLVLPLDPDDTTRTVVNKRLYPLRHLGLSTDL